MKVKRIRQTVYYAALICIILIAFCAAAAPWIAPCSPTEQHIEDRFSKPGENGYILGTDDLGRDVLSRIIYGSRSALLVGFTTAAAAMIIGLATGLAAGSIDFPFSCTQGGDNMLPHSCFQRCDSPALPFLVILLMLFFLFSLLFMLLFRLDSVLDSGIDFLGQNIADQIERKHRHGNDDSRVDGQIGRSEYIVSGILQHQPPAWIRRLNAESQVGE